MSLTSLPVQPPPALSADQTDIKPFHNPASKSINRNLNPTTTATTNEVVKGAYEQDLFAMKICVLIEIL